MCKVCDDRIGKVNKKIVKMRDKSIIPWRLPESELVKLKATGTRLNLVDYRAINVLVSAWIKSLPSNLRDEANKPISRRVNCKDILEKWDTLSAHFWRLSVKAATSNKPQTCVLFSYRLSTGDQNFHPTLFRHVDMRWETRQQTCSRRL